MCSTQTKALNSISFSFQSFLSKCHWSIHLGDSSLPCTSHLLMKEITSISHPQVDFWKDSKQGVQKPGSGSPSLTSFTTARCLYLIPLGGSAQFQCHLRPTAGELIQPDLLSLSQVTDTASLCDLVCSLGTCLIPKPKVPYGFHCSYISV
jgi:hypothetical protein